MVHTRSRIILGVGIKVEFYVDLYCKQSAFQSVLAKKLILFKLKIVLPARKIAF